MDNPLYLLGALATLLLFALVLRAVWGRGGG
jgi:hypothetical protein